MIQPFLSLALSFSSHTRENNLELYSLFCIYVDVSSSLPPWLSPGPQRAGRELNH